MHPVLVMFDGLDEVFEPGKREDVITDIHRFTNQYPKVRVIVTSRVIGYKPQRLRDAEFRHVMLQDLESEQIQTFIQQWHELTFSDQADKVRKRERLQKAIETSSPIRQLAGNPLLLTMMAILNRNQELPRDRSELYNQSSRLLLHQWDVERALLEDNRLDPKTIDYQDKQQILGKVAYFMQGNQAGLAGNLISGEDLERIIKHELKLREVTHSRAVAKVMINQLRTRNFILCFMGGDDYAFVHRTFLEYFCAWEFVRQFEKEQRINLYHLKTKVFGKHWRDESWHEVLRLIVGMIDSNKGGEIIEYLMAQDGKRNKFLNLFLAADCLSEVRNRYEIKSTDSRLLNHLKDLTRNRLSDITIQAVVALGTHWQDHRDTLAILQESARCDTDSDVRSKAIEQLAQGYKDHPDTLALLQELARSDSYWIEQLAQGYKDHPDTLAILKESARCDTDSDVRATAIEQLAQGYKDHPDTLAILQESARCDTDSYVRYKAIKQLAQGYKDHPDTLATLKESGRCDTDSDVRFIVIELLAKSYKYYQDILALLQELARCDTDSDVRYKAIKQLAEGGQDQPWLFKFLCDRTRHDPFERKEDWETNPRQVALNAIFKYYPNHSQTRSLLLDRAEHDSDPKLRKFAKENLELLMKRFPN